MFKDILNRFFNDLDRADDEDERTDEELVSSYSDKPEETSFDDDYTREPRRAPRKTPRYSEEDPQKVVNIHTTAKLQVVLSKPEKNEDAREIADNLKEKRTVVLNLEGTNKEVARRLLDFLTGVAYANGGSLKRISNNTFIITPYNVDVSGDLLDELENTGVFF